MTDKPIYAWHFSDGSLRFDKSDVEVKAGLILETDDEPEVEKVGFHACRGAHDALFNLSSRPVDNLVVSRVKLSGKIITADYGYEILVAQRREHLWVAPANMTLEDAVASYVADLHQLIRSFGGIPSPKAGMLLKKRHALIKAGSNIKAFKEVSEAFKADMELGDFSDVDAFEESSVVRAAIEEVLKDTLDSMGDKNKVDKGVLLGVRPEFSNITPSIEAFLKYVWDEIFNKKEVYEDTRILELLLYPYHLSTLYFVVEVMTKLIRLAEKIYMNEARKLYIRENENELRETLLEDLLLSIQPQGIQEVYSLYVAKGNLDAYEDWIQQNIKIIRQYIRDGRNGAFPLWLEIPLTPSEYYERLKAQYILKSPNDKLHDMLMQLAPEGYSEL